MPLARTYALSTTGENLEDQLDKITDSEYMKIANDYLEGLSYDLEGISEEYPQVDCELSQGVLTLTVPPAGTYIINRQPPNKQIWLSSPISGPKRYDLVNGKWTTFRDGSLLTPLLEKEISDTLGTDITFEEVDR